MAMVSVFGETLVGVSNVFSSVGLPDVKTMDLAVGARVAAALPLRWMAVSIFSAEPLTTFRMSSPVLESRVALA